MVQSESTHTQGIPFVIRSARCPACTYNSTRAASRPECCREICRLQRPPSDVIAAPRASCQGGVPLPFSHEQPARSMRQRTPGRHHRHHRRGGRRRGRWRRRCDRRLIVLRNLKKHLKKYHKFDPASVDPAELEPGDTACENSTKRRKIDA